MSGVFPPYQSANYLEAQHVSDHAAMAADSANIANHTAEHALLGTPTGPRMLRRSQIATSILCGIPCANESLWPDGTWSTVYGENTRKRFITNRATSSIRVVFTTVGGTVDAATTSPVTYSCGFEITNGATRVPFMFDGEVSKLCAPNSLIISDPIRAPMSALQQFWLVPHAEGPNIFYHGLNKTQTAWGEGCDAAFNTAVSDKSVAGTVGVNSASHVSPICVIGDTGDGLPCVLHFGDSIAAGLGDTSITDYGAGFLRRAMTNTIPYISVAVSGDLYANNHAFRIQMAQVCTDVIDEMGINDIKGGATLAAIQANAIGYWNAFAAYGCRVWKTTITPYTTSTDSWATGGNQTPSAYEAVRIAFNAWIRAGAPILAGTAVAIGTTGALLAGQAGHPLSGYFETANTVECNSAGVLTQDGGRWLPGSVYLTDTLGLHPSSAGAAAMALAINTSKFVGL